MAVLTRAAVDIYADQPVSKVVIGVTQKTLEFLILKVCLGLA